MIRAREMVVFCAFGLALGATGCDAVNSCAGQGSSGGTIVSDASWQCTNAPYVVDRDLVIGGGATLTIAPGVTVEVANEAAIVVGRDEAGGAIVADGTEAPIRFTSTASVGEPGQWGGIVVGPHATEAVFRGVTIEYGGDRVTDGTTASRTALLVSSSAEIVDSTVRASAGHGIAFTEAGRASAFSGNTFADNFRESVAIHGNHLGSLSGPNRFDAGDRVRVEGDVVDTSAVWTNVGVPYHVVDDLRVEGDTEPAEITIQNRARFEFAPQTSLLVGHGGPGGVTVRGTSIQPIVFTSDQETPAPGDWQGVQLDRETTTAVFEHVEFRYAGEAQSIASVRSSAALTILGGPPTTILECGFYDSEGHALFLSADGRIGEYDQNDFDGNLLTAIRTAPNAVGSLAATNALAGIDQLWIDGGVIEESATWSKTGVPYWIHGDIWVRGDDDPVLTLAPGIVVFLERQTSLVIGGDAPGTLVAEGTKNEPIVLTSPQYPATPGDWEGLMIDRGATASLNRVALSYCGAPSDAGSRPIEACLGIAGTQATVQNCAFSYSANHGVELEQGGTLFDPLVFSNTFEEIEGLSFHQETGY